jgi:iron complex outermembrane receptor protein
MTNRGKSYHAWLLSSAAAVSMMAGGAAAAEDARFNIAPQPLASALNEFSMQSKQSVLFTTDLAQSKSSPGVSGQIEVAEALSNLLAGTGLTWRRQGDTFLVQPAEGGSPQSGSAAGGGAEVEGLIVTAQKREENIQDVPIAMSAFSQEDLTERQVAGGPDLITQIPNMSFTKTNFTSYSIQIRGIGTQAISATTDPAVAVAFNNTPFIRNRFFEQEFFDLERLEVLRGPQGTLYGRNATAGVVNLISAKPKFTYQAKLSADLANYNSSRIEGMVNIPLVDDVVALRLAGAWTRREGFATNQMTGTQIDGRDLWSTRMSLRFEPTDWLSANFIWEHFQEDDDRLRSGKQLCKKHLVTQVGGVAVTPGGGVYGNESYLSQGCTPVSLYSAEAFQTPNGYALPFYGPTAAIGNPVNGNLDPYRSSTQSRDLRVIESSVEPEYRSNSDVAELQFSIDLSDAITLNSETAYSADSLFSMQDYNRFTTVPGAFVPRNDNIRPNMISPTGVFCDPQLGCSDRLLLVDLSTSDSTQFSQELRISSDFDGSFNFSLGANYLRHDAEDKYYVFVNSLTLFAAQFARDRGIPWDPGVTDNSSCLTGYGATGGTAVVPDARDSYGFGLANCMYIDPNPIGSLNDEGRNYFLSRNPYKLISYAVFGETYYQIADNLKLTAGLRWTVDRKTAPQIPSWLLATDAAGPYPTTVTVFQEWREPTGRLALDWKPDLGFTDETLIYASYAHGYKAGGANPPPPVLVSYGSAPPDQLPNEAIPETFGPEFVDAFELGAKNTLFDGKVTLNLTGFYYDYKGYQTSEIRNRSAVNSNFDAEVWGAELEADWRVTEALRLGLKGGWQNTRMADGSEAIDLMDRTAGNEDWVVLRPFATVPSNCILPVYVVTAGGGIRAADFGGSASSLCEYAYFRGVDPITLMPYVPNPTVGLRNSLTPQPLGVQFAGYPGFDPATAPNGGKGIFKDLSGNELPNAPNYTATLTADYSVSLAGDWLLNLHGDYHYQSESWGRVINSDPYDRIEAFSMVNVAGIFTNEDAGWKVMAYVKNVFDETAITGTFLNSDDTGLTTNVFLTEPRLYGLRVTKDFTSLGSLGDFGERHDGARPITVEIGGGTGRFSGDSEVYEPDWLQNHSPTFPLDQSFQDEDLDWGDTRSVKLTYAPSQDWRVSAGYRFGKTNSALARASGYEEVEGGYFNAVCFVYCTGPTIRNYVSSLGNHWRGSARDSEEHAIIDLEVGREVGFGSWGDGGRSMLGLGLRHADLRSTSVLVMDGIPARVSPADYTPISPFFALPGFPIRYHDSYTTMLESERGFEGVGPTATWEASIRLAGDEEHGHADVDWAISGGVLFGKQTLDSDEAMLTQRFTGSYPLYKADIVLLDDNVPRSRTEDVTVPNLSLSVGLSYSIDRVKVSTGYSYDRFFDAIDGGVEDAQTFDRTIHGPYLKLSVGFGG